MNWKEEASKVVETEMKFLKVFYPNLPKAEIVYEEGVRDASINKGESIVKGLTCGLYAARSQTITLYVDSIARIAGHKYESFKEGIMRTLAHEFMHHWQFTGENRESRIRAHKEDKENNVPYWNQTLEVEAREAADWYVKRRQPLVLNWGR